ncbi:hypothetical protein [Streptomyces sp. NPDC059743]|uniref:hypothetical protein n=1 Tax=Streptomyces sp. NPDC059743 TaxID=3346928 RepID=UPI00365A48E4
MSFSLACCVQATARLLDACGPLVPLQLGLSAQDVQVEMGGPGPAARESLDRLAAVTGADLIQSPPDAATMCSLTADLAEGPVLVAGASASPGGCEDRATSTQQTADLLRAALPWLRNLDEQHLGAPELWVNDQGSALTVRLLLAAAEGDDLDELGAAVGRGLERLRLWRSDSGVDGTGRLPGGRTVRIAVVRSY